MRSFFVLSLALAFAAADKGRAQDVVRSDSSYVVHEWGTFTTITRGDGKDLLWHPLVAASELPGFVTDIRGWSKVDLRGTVRMETPVLYFYAKAPLSIDASVQFRGGKFTEWYPDAQSDRKGSSLRWPRVDLTPLPASAQALPPFPREAVDNHYYRARAVDATPLRVETKKGAQHERFLFYRGVGSFELPLRVEYAGSGLRVTKKGKSPIRYLVFERRGKKVDYGVYVAGGAKNGLVVPLPFDRGGVRWDSDHVEALERMLIYSGLYRKEAKAMLASWKHTWFEEGRRVIWIVPQDFTDKVLPLRLEPKPKEAVRILVGRIELIDAQLEARVAHVAKRIVELAANRGAGAELANTRKLDADVVALGRFGLPLLSRLGESMKKGSEAAGRWRAAFYRYLTELDKRQRSERATQERVR